MDGFGKEKNQRIQELLLTNIAECTFTAASYVFGDNRAVHYGFLGTLGGKDTESGNVPVNSESLYDLASCSKIFTGLVILKLIDEQRIHLNTRVEEVLPSFSTEVGKCTIYELLTHTSGLPAHIPLYELANSKEKAMDCLIHADVKKERTVVYSCMGFIILGWMIESVTGTDLESAVRHYVLEPFGMHNTLYSPAKKNRSNVVATEFCRYRNQRVCGDVHDENAWILDGVAGNAGVFSTIHDMSILAKVLLTGKTSSGQNILSEELFGMMKQDLTCPYGEHRGLIWVINKEEDSFFGTEASENSYGHTGFTGTSIVINPIQNQFGVLLTNRVYYTRDAVPIRKVRKAFYDICFQ